MKYAEKDASTGCDNSIYLVTANLAQSRKYGADLDHKQILFSLNGLSLYA